MFCMSEEIKEILENMKKKEWMKCKWHNNSLSHQKPSDFNLSKFFLLFIWKPLQPLAFEKNRSLHHLFLKYFLSCNKAPRSCWNGHYMKKYIATTSLNWKIAITWICGSCILQLLHQLLSASPSYTGPTLFTHAYSLSLDVLFVLIFLLSSYQVQPQIISLENILF